MGYGWRFTGRVVPVLGLALAGCLPVPTRPDPPQAPLAVTDGSVVPASHVEARTRPLAVAAAPEPAVVGGAQPVDAYIRQALASNALVRAARFNVLALQHRVPQVTALDDPILSNTIYPIPAVAPQYSLMGYMPYGALLAQQFPWFGTLRLRGEAAEQDVKIALYELAATQLDTVANVKRAYHDLHFSERAEAILLQNRALAEDFLKVARERYRGATATQADVLRAEVAISDIDREVESNHQARNEARSELARLLHVSPESDLRTLPASPVGGVPAEVQRLYQLAITGRPDLQGRLAAISRDRTAIELAEKRYYPNVTLGLVYQNMQKKNAMTPDTAEGMPNVGLFVGFNLPVYRKKLAAGLCEARARANADAALYEAERDQSHRDIKDSFVQARVQQNILGLLQRTNLPAARQVLETTASDYRAGNAGVDYLALISAWRDVLQLELQVAQIEAELGKALAGLERAVGCQLNEHPPDPAALVPPVAPTSPPPATQPGPFHPGAKPSDARPGDVPITTTTPGVAQPIPATPAR